MRRPRGPRPAFQAGLGAALLALAVGAAASGVARAQDGVRSGEFGHRADAYLQYSLSGADFSADPGGDYHFEGVYTGGTISFSGTMIVDRTAGLVSYVTMKASLGDESVSWPGKGEDSKVQGRAVQLPFNFSYTVPRGYAGTAISGGARMDVCGGVCGVYEIGFTIRIPAGTVGSAPEGSGASSGSAAPGGDDGLLPIGFGPLETVPGPEGLTEALGGVLGPALIGLIIAIAGGVMGSTPPPVPGPTAPPSRPRGYHGQTRSWIDEDGRTQTEKYDAVTDSWVSPQAWEAESRTRKALSDAIDADRAANEDLDTRRQNLEKILAPHKEKLDLLQKLQKARRQALDLGIGERGGPGDVQGKLDRMIRDLADGRLPDPAQVDSVIRVIESQASGRSLDSRHISPDALEVNTVSWVVRGAGATAHEVITATDSEGNTSYKSLILRGAITFISGGAADLVYTSAEFGVRVKDGLDQGQSGVDAIWGAAKQTVADELIGAGIARGIAGGAKALAKTFPGLEKPVIGGTRPRPPRRPAGTSGVGWSSRPPRAGAAVGGLEKSAIGSKAAGTTGYAPAPGANVPAMTRGMPAKNVKHLQVVADKHGVQIHVRQTNPDARRWLETGQGVPKREFIKNKTINELDELLGAPGGSRGLAGSFEPKLPGTKPAGMTDATWDKLKSRYKSRMQEFTDQRIQINDLRASGKIEVRDGVIFDRKTGKPMTGDHDIFDIRGHDGRPLPDSVKNRVIQDLKGPPFEAQHGDHMSWYYANKSRATPTAGYGPASGRQSPYDVANSIDNKILDSHSPGAAGRPGEPLITINPDRPATASYYTGGRRG